MFIVEWDIYLKIVLGIQIQSIMWATLIGKIIAIHIQTPIILGGGSTPTSGQNIPAQPPRFHQPNQGHRNTSNDQLSSFEALLKEYIVKNEAIVQSQAVSLRNLENQIGQFATALSN